MQSLCCLDAQGAKAMDLVQEFISDSDEPAAVLIIARRMLKDSYDDRTACDELLSRHARKWELSRLAMVDRNILRLAVWEMRTNFAPPAVVINEAIKMAQEFSTAESPRFINGVLDSIARELSGKGAPAS